MEKLPIYVLVLAGIFASCDSGSPDQFADNKNQTGDIGIGGADQNTLETVEPIVVHSFGEQTLAPGEETTPCVSWTLNNEKAIYVNKITLANEGGYHHSNWFVIPEDLFPGEDGFWPCRSRGYDQFKAATEGTVLFAQSTQSKVEDQKFPDGVVIKIPPRHKVVADVHLLNISTLPHTTDLRMQFDLVHPRDVDVVVTPFRLTYLDLFVPANSRSRSQAECDVSQRYEEVSGVPFNLQLYWVLPHYHALGNEFSLSIRGGPRDGEVLYELSGFNAEANGKGFDPPVDMTGSTGFNFHCGFDNPWDKSVRWGIGDNEMCVMLGFAKADAIFDAWVLQDSEYIGNENGVEVYEGPCTRLVLPKSDRQSPPDDDEIAGDLYVPPSDVTDDFTTVEECVDTPPDPVPTLATTLTSVKENIFEVSCAFSACHDSTNPAFGLDLVSEGLHDRLLNHEPRGQSDLPLISAGDAEASWLYHAISKCDPGAIGPMPQNSPVLLDEGLVGSVKAWIELGARND